MCYTILLPSKSRGTATAGISAVFTQAVKDLTPKDQGTRQQQYAAAASCFLNVVCQEASATPRSGCGWVSLGARHGHLPLGICLRSGKCGVENRSTSQHASGSRMVREVVLQFAVPKLVTNAGDPNEPCAIAGVEKVPEPPGQSVFAAAGT